jgi:flagellin
MPRIVTNQSAVTVYKNLSRSENALDASMERLASGLRINRAADDAAGLAISESFRAQIKGANMAIENINNAINFINTADGYLQNVSDILGRMEELAVQFGDATKADPEGTLDSGDLHNINVEFWQLCTELTAIIGDGSTGVDNFARAKYNAAAIFTDQPRDFQVGPDAGQIFSIPAGSLDLANDTQFEQLQILMNDYFTAGDTVGEPIALGEYGDSTVGTLAEIQGAIAQVSSFRALMGSYMSQLRFTMAGLQNYSENISAAESRIRNVDVALEATNLARNQILVQAGTAMLAQANQLPQNVLQLLGR